MTKLHMNVCTLPAKVCLVALLRSYLCL